MKELIFLTLFINQCFVIGEAYFDVQKVKDKETIRHTQSAFFRGLAWAMTGAAINYGVWGMAVLYALLLGFQYWFSFNLFYNAFFGHPWYYGAAASFFDSVLPGYDNRWKHLGLKALLLAMTAFIYFDLYEHIYNR